MMAQAEFATAYSSFAEAQHRASLLLIAREFEKCLEVCREALNSFKINIIGGEKLTIKQCQEVEGLVLVLIQAFAELERWQEVLPFVTGYYHGIENVSPNILKLCLLLHARVREYSICSAIYNIWNRSNADTHINSDEMEMLLDVYITQVLIPTRKYPEIAGLIRSTRLDSTRQQRLIDLYENVVKESKSAGKTCDSESSSGDSAYDSHQTPLTTIGSILEKALTVVRVTMQWIRMLRPRNIHTVMATLLGIVSIVGTVYYGIPTASLDILQHWLMGKSTAAV